jgi:membrane-bound serine protease (ClpP class)
MIRSLHRGFGLAALAGMRAGLRIAAAVFASLLFWAPTGAAGQSTATGRVVYRVPVTGVIEQGLAPFIERSLREATEAGAQAVILDIDTPGGRIDSAERITDAIRDADVPVYAFVNRRAFSAGAMISLAARQIYMLPGSVIGAATPVDGSGTKAPEKAVSAMRSEMRALAEQRGLDPRVAEAMVDDQLDVPGVKPAGQLLTLTTSEAASYRYAVPVESFEDVLTEIGSAGAQVYTMDVNWAEQVVRFLTHPAVAPFLLSLGFLGLIIEIKAPGFGLPGALGLAALSAFFGSHLLLGLAGWEDLLIVGAGVVLLAVEIFVIPGFGIAGLLGIGAMVGGLFLTMLGGYPTAPEIAQVSGIITTSLLAIVVVAWALIRRAPGSRHLARRGIFLTSKTSRETGFTTQEQRPELVGIEGVALTDLRPTGVGQFGEEHVDVVSDSGWVTQGTPIKILASEGYRHVVRPVAGS